MGRAREAPARKMVRMRRWVCEMSWYFEAMRLKRREPSITEDMKQANMGTLRGFQCGCPEKTKRYIEPSKKQDARPRVRIRWEVKAVLREDLLGG